MYRVLLVDDEKFIRKSIRNRIDWEKYGFVVEAEAGNGEEALSLLEEIRPELVLVDIRMPVMNGYEATKAIRALTARDDNDLPIIAMTADAFSDDVQVCLECGMNVHAAKPLDILVLMNLISRFLK